MYVVSQLSLHSCFAVQVVIHRQKYTLSGNGVFTLADTDTDTKTDILQHSPMALLSWCSVNTSTRFYTTHFLSVSMSLSMSGGVNAP